MTVNPPPRAAHPYYMHDAIYAQPGALRLLERGNESALSAAAAAIRGANRVWIAGVGSSWHAALVGEHVLATTGGLGARVRAVVASEWTEYGPSPEPAEVLIAVSHRGSRVTADAVSHAPQRGAVGGTSPARRVALACAAPPPHTPHARAPRGPTPRDD